jgi:hypothetical protein
MLLEGAVSVPDADAKVPCEEHDAQECERGEEVVAGVDERKRDDEMDVRLNQDGWDRHVEEWVLLLDGYVERDDLAGVILVVPCHWQKKMGNLVEIRENGLLAVDSRPWMDPSPWTPLRQRRDRRIFSIAAMIERLAFQWNHSRRHRCWWHAHVASNPCSRQGIGMTQSFVILQFHGRDECLVFAIVADRCAMMDQSQGQQ